MPPKPQRWVIAMTGATGVIYGIRLLEALREHPEIETHLILSKPAIQTIAYETDWKLEDVKKLADQCHSHQNIASALASGSFFNSRDDCRPLYSTHISIDRPWNFR